MSSPLPPGLRASLDLLIPRIDLIDGEFTPEQLAALEAAKQNFLAAGPEILAAATEHLWAYYRDIVQEFSPEDRAEYGIPELAEDADIWAEVPPPSPRSWTSERTRSPRPRPTCRSRARCRGSRSTVSSWCSRTAGPSAGSGPTTATAPTPTPTTTRHS